MTCQTLFKSRSFISILMLSTVCAVSSTAASALDLEAQRALYEKSQRWLDEKNVSAYQAFANRSPITR